MEEATSFSWCTMSKRWISMYTLSRNHLLVVDYNPRFNTILSWLHLLCWEFLQRLGSPIVQKQLWKNASCLNLLWPVHVLLQSHHHACTMHGVSMCLDMKSLLIVVFILCLYFLSFWAKLDSFNLAHRCVVVASAQYHCNGLWTTWTVQVKHVLSPGWWCSRDQVLPQYHTSCVRTLHLSFVPQRRIYIR